MPLIIVIQSRFLRSSADVLLKGWRGERKVHKNVYNNHFDLMGHKKNDSLLSIKKT